MTQRAEEALLRRREFLQTAALAAPLAFFPGAETPKKERPPAGLIVRQRQPENLEFPFATLDCFLIPNERFFIRNHFPVPEVSPRTWRLKVEGAVRRPLMLTYDDLKKLPARTLTATVECAGNSRSLLRPKVGGVQWATGAVGNAEWTGVPLAAVLERAGLKATALEVILEGADRGALKASPGVIPYSRSLPLAKARRPEVLLAFKMNGAELPKAHGFPLRAVVAGWYGMACVKWLTRILVVEKPFAGFFQTIDYTYWETFRGLKTLKPVTAIPVKSLVASPGAGEVLPAGKVYRIRGAAWAGESEIAKVEVSTDGGKTQHAAKLLGKSVPFAWRLWEYEWKPARAGKYVVMARATDRGGQTQPLKRDTDRRSYMITHVLPVEVTVR